MNDLKEELIKVRNKLFELGKEAEKIKVETKFGKFSDLELLHQIDSSRLNIGNALMRL